MYSLKILLNNENDSYVFGKLVANIISLKFIVFLNGNLGSGKTVISSGIIHGLLDNYNIFIKSPTFSIVEVYKKIELSIYHFDLYRLNTVDDLYSIGFKDYLKNNYIFILEWPEKFTYFLPNPHLVINIYILNIQVRYLILKSNYINLKKLFG